MTLSARDIICNFILEMVAINALLWILVIPQELSTKGISMAFSEEQMEVVPNVRRGGVIDLRCINGRNILRMMSGRQIFNPHTEWLLIDSEDQPAEDVSDINALPSSCVTLAKVNETHVHYYDIYRTSVYTSLRISLVSEQALSKFITLPERPSRTDLGGITLRTGVVILYPFAFDGFNSTNFTEFDTPTKVAYPIATTLMEQHNFKVAVVTANDFGYRQKNGSISGLWNLFLRGEVEFSLTTLFMRDERINTLDFTGDVYDLINKLIFKQPALPTVSNIYVLPFSPGVWLCSVLSTLLTAIFLRLDSAITLNGRKSFQQPLSFGEAIIMVIGHISQQGSSAMPERPSSKTTLFTFSMAAIFFFTYYSANIVRLLQSTSHTINSIADLTRSQLTVLAQDVVYTRPYFEETQDKDEKELYIKKILPLGERAYCLPKEGMELVRSGSYAFKVEEAWGYKLISDTFEEREKCLIGILDIFLIPRSSLPLLKRSGYREIFTRSVARQRDAGFISRSRLQWLRRKPKCEGRGNGFANVGLDALRPAFFLLIYAFLISFTLLILEIFYNLKKKNNSIPRKGLWM